MEQIELFIEKAQSDSELAAKLEEMRINDAGVEEFIALATEYGFTLTKEDIEQSPNDNGELSEEQLENVAGGNPMKTGDNCYFEPASPVTLKRRYDGAIWALCRKKCNFIWTYCFCFKTSWCVDKYHKLDPTEADGYAYPWEKSTNRHDQSWSRVLIPPEWR